VRKATELRFRCLLSRYIVVIDFRYGERNAVTSAIGYAMYYSRSPDAVIRVYDAAGNVLETHEHAGDFKEW